MSKKQSKVWWLANGSSSTSRQPSFAPPTARPVINTSIYNFGWDKEKSSFISQSRHDILAPPSTKEYPCDPKMAFSILRRCAYKSVSDRFFNPYAREDDKDIFAASGQMFGIILRKRYVSRDYQRDAEVSLHFYKPDRTLQAIHLSNGMTLSFAGTLSGMQTSEIRANMS